MTYRMKVDSSYDDINRLPMIKFFLDTCIFPFKHSRKAGVFNE